MSDTRHLTILQINDTHGYLESHPEFVWTKDGPAFPLMGGYARIASVFDEARLDNPDGVIALDNGDTFHSTYPAMESKGHALIPLVNALGLDAMTAHWEFAWGPGHFRSIASRLNHPMLAINCYEKDTGERPFRPSILLERCGLKIGVIGIAATIVDKSMPPHFSEGLHFTDGREELPQEIERLRAAEGADIIVVLSHLGFPQDVKLAKQMSGIDVLASGHTHNRLEHPVKVRNTLLIQSGCHGSFVGRLDLEVRDGDVVGHRHRLIPVDEKVRPQEAMRSLVEDAMRPHRAMLGEVVGHTSIPLHRNTQLDSPMDDVLLAAISAVAGTDIAFSNGWRYGAPVPPGPVTVNDLWNIIPTNPPVSTVELTGAEIVAMLEENLERTFAADPFGQMGGYLKRFRGLAVFGKIENPEGHRIETILTGSGPLRPESMYRAAFVTSQGVPAKYGRERVDLPISAIDALRAYFQANRNGSARSTGRFIAV